MKSRKPSKASEPSLLDELSTPLRDLVADFKEHGADALQTVRQQDPQKYLDLCTKILPLVTAFNPSKNEFSAAQSREELAAALLRSVGLAEEASEDQIAAAIDANSKFIAQLEAIRDAASLEEGELN